MHLRKINPCFILFYILYLTHTIFPLFNYIQPTGELPSDWTAYMDTDGNIPYYYNSRTGENTYDHPLATVMKEQVIASREASKQGDEAWSRGTVADYWLAFGGESVTYYNLRTRKTFRSPPHIAREAAQTIVKIMRLKDDDTHSVKREDIVDAFHALDGDQSGSVSASELRPVLIHLGGLSEAEVDSFVASADIDGDGEMDYNEFVDTLWTRAADQTKKAIDGGLDQNALTHKEGKETYEVHGHVHDASNEKAIQRAEEIEWKTEQEQRLIKDDLLVLAGKVEQTSGKVKDAWTIIDYNRALDLLSRGRLVQVFDEKDKYHTGVAPIAKQVMKAITQYEEAEAERRAAAIMQGHTDEANQLGSRR